MCKQKEERKGEPSVARVPRYPLALPWSHGASLRLFESNHCPSQPPEPGSDNFVCIQENRREDRQEERKS